LEGETKELEKFKIDNVIIACTTTSLPCLMRKKMSETIQIILTSALSIIGGIALLVFGEIFTRFIIEPIYEQKKLISEIAEALIFHSNLYLNPGVSIKEDQDKAQDILRQKASLLRAKTYAIPWYDVFASLRLVRNHSQIEEASRNLIGLSNSIHQGDPFVNKERRGKIKSALNLYLGD
jgi:hypothetical protein